MEQGRGLGEALLFHTHMMDAAETEQQSWKKLDDVSQADVALVNMRSVVPPDRPLPGVKKLQSYLQAFCASAQDRLASIGQ